MSAADKNDNVGLTEFIGKETTWWMKNSLLIHDRINSLKSWMPESSARSRRIVCSGRSRGIMWWMGAGIVFPGRGDSFGGGGATSREQAV